jgi:ATP/maltotriose-dependent transcriptional regulator MalT
VGGAQVATATAALVVLALGILLVGRLVAAPSPFTFRGAAPEAVSTRSVFILAALTLALAAGQSNAEIAAALVVAIGTVKAHIQHIYRKLDAHSRTHALARARNLDLLENFPWRTVADD